MNPVIPLNILELEPQSYHLLANITINNSITGLVIIDTGASRTVFDYQTFSMVAANISLIHDAVSSSVNAMVAQCYTATFNQIEFDGFIIEPYNTVLMDLQHVIDLYKQFHQTPILGLIGSDFLHQHGAIIDYGQAHPKLFCNTTSQN
jgi:hypothetical protein